MTRIIVVCSLVMLLSASARWIGHAQQEDTRFTGHTDVLDAKDLNATRRSFDAGARSAWHSHSKGQLLFVEDGRARVQRKGQPVRELGSGETDYTGPNVVHWHGATPDRKLVQVALSFGETKWMEKVTDAEYAGR
jgi:quercetin dioxygenase-like cupin family protein